MSPEDAPVGSNRNRDGAAQCVRERVLTGFCELS